MTQLIIVRHGETQSNRDGRFQGHIQTELNATGREQALRLGRRLQNETFDALYSSDLLRARQTADAIAALGGHRPLLDRRLREWDLGVLAGLTHDVAMREYPRAYEIYRDNLVDQVVPGGESVVQRYRRIIAAMEAIAARHPAQTVVIVTHGGPLGDCYRRATNMSLQAPKTFQIYNGGINRFSVDGQDWTLDSWAEIDHLDGVGTLGNWHPKPS